MDFPAVLAQLNDLPNTFKRQGAPYTQLMDSLASSLSLFTSGDDAVFGQVTSFGAALDGWLDVWGLLFGVARNANESNSVYETRISRTVLAWVGTVPAIQAWLNFYANGGTITENAGLGYVLTLPNSMTTNQVVTFLISLNRIRPIGVPFTIFQIGTGLFLGTEEFLGTGAVMGTYLAGGSTPLTLPIGATTLNTQPILPDLYLTDPTLNP